MFFIFVFYYFFDTIVKFSRRKDHRIHRKRDCFGRNLPVDGKKWFFSFDKSGHLYFNSAVHAVEQVRPYV
ncbi:MAG: hypothetical protein DSY57_00555 [Desulfobulbus sp.]|nr:MAG: hypothetical protein DSY57_00555 [Desulfobulbus sp.]